MIISIRRGLTRSLMSFVSRCVPLAATHTELQDSVSYLAKARLRRKRIQIIRSLLSGVGGNGLAFMANLGFLTFQRQSRVIFWR